MATILVITSDVAFGDALAAALPEVGAHECLRASTGADGLTLAYAVHPDLVVLAWSLPDRPGLDVCKRLLAHHPIPVIFVAEAADEQSRIDGFLAGARDFVVMPVSLRELTLRIRAILRRRLPSQRPRETPQSMLRIDRSARRVWVADREIELTRGELELLLALHDSGRTCSREELRRRAWGRDATVQLHSVDTYVKRLRLKLGDGAIETVRHVGYRLATDRASHETSPSRMNAGPPSDR